MITVFMKCHIEKATDSFFSAVMNNLCTGAEISGWPGQHSTSPSSLCGLVILVTLHFKSQLATSHCFLWLHTLIESVFFI